MKWAIRIGLAVAALLVLGLVALGALLPGLIERPEVQAQIQAAARDATGRELHYEKLEVGLLPPRLMVDTVRLEGGPGTKPLAAERVALEIALLPLLARTVLVDTLVVEGASLELRRTAKGIELPIEPPEPEPKGDAEVTADATEEPAEADASGGVSVAVREVRIERTDLTLVDATVSPPVSWRLQDLALAARGRLAEDLPVALELTAMLEDAPVRVEGDVTLAGGLDLELAVADFALAALGPYLPPETVLAGSADLELALEGDAEAFAGPLALELTDAEIRQGESFRKPAGERMALRGRVEREGEAFRLEDGELALRDAAIALAVETAPRTRATLSAEPFALEGFGGWLPALAESGARGALALEEVVVTLDPLGVEGGIVLDGVGAPVGEAQGLLTGRLEGEGNALRGEGLELALAEQRFRVGLDVDDLAGEPRARVRLDSDAADAGKLIAGVSGQPSTLEGPLELNGDVRAPLAGSDSLVEALAGKLTLNVSPGRLRGVSLLRSALDALGGAGRAAELLGGDKRGRLERFEKDAFELLAGSFDIGGGLARTDDLRLVYDDYQVDLRGALGLADQSLDFKGRLTVFEDLDRALAEGAAAGEAPSRGVKRELPLAAVKGTLDAPRVVIAPEVALRFAAAYYAGGERREKLEEKIDERLGEGAGKQVIDLFDSVLGGGRPKEPRDE
ncbi:MAG: AsmA-like C-terminal region-containing protein [Myxococcota bacterium]